MNKTDREIQIASAMEMKESGKATKEVALTTGASISAVNRWWKRYKAHRESQKSGTTTSIFQLLASEPDQEIIEKSVNLARSRQRLMDSNRIERKAFREHARVVNALEDMNKSLLEALHSYQFNINTVEHQVDVDSTNPPIGVVQVSDAHINMVISDVQENVFDTTIASKRLYKHTCLSINKFKAEGVKKVVLALTGDLVKNIQHLSEISQNSMSRANCVFIAVDIFSQMIQLLNDEGFNVVVASVVGNESRTTEANHETDFLASDSFDLMIHKMLQIVWMNKPGVEVVPMTNTMECVLNLNGSNLLLLHGHAHGRFASTSSLEKNTDSIVARYVSTGIKIDYVILGHIHSAYISDKFARSGGLPGTDEYAARKLNLFGRASQNSFIFYSDGSIDGFKHDLQNVNGWLGFNFDPLAEILAIQNVVRPGRLGGNVNLSINGQTFQSYTV